MKKLFLYLLIISFLFASNFSLGIKAYKQKDYEKAFNYFEKAVIEDNVNNANFFLGLLYLNGLGTKKDIDKAQKYLKKAANIGNARAKCYLAEIYILKDDKIDAIKLLKEGLKEGASDCKEIAKKYNIKL